MSVAKSYKTVTFTDEESFAVVRALRARAGMLSEMRAEMHADPETIAALGKLLKATNECMQRVMETRFVDVLK